MASSSMRSITQLFSTAVRGSKGLLHQGGAWRAVSAPAVRERVAEAQKPLVSVSGTGGGKGKLEALREQLNQDTRTIHDFLGIEDSSRPAEKASRDEEMHRSVLGQLKPDHCKADGSFKRLRSIVKDRQFQKVKKSLSGLSLNTVCEEAKCPNVGECWGGESGVATATIMLMGDTCTRGCKFCNIKTSNAPPPLDPNEPFKVAQVAHTGVQIIERCVQVADAISRWGLDYVVLTSVDRDDLPDGGASHFAQTISHLKSKDANVKIEALVSDYGGNQDCVKLVCNSGLDVYAHNIETVERLQNRVRDLRAGYKQSLKTLEVAKATSPSLVTKSSIMLGVGETDEEVFQAMRDLRSAGVEIVTFGQYLRPSRKHMRVYEYLPEAKYDFWREEGEKLGFAYVASGPLVRSSYKAGEFFIKAVLNERKKAAAATA